MSLKAVNMYLFLGKKACEVTWIYGKRILFNRSILISNQDLDIDAYLRESLPRLVNTIGVSRNQLKKDGVIGDNPDKIFLFGVENKFVHSAGSQSSARDKVGLSSKNIVNKISKIINKH